MTKRPRAEVASLLIDPGVIAVVRTQTAEPIVPLAEALVAGGVIAVEITLTVPNALTAIRQLRQTLGPRAVVGVGTVLTARQAKEALDAGAEFVVSPILRPELVAVAHEADRPVMLGAYTPTEAQAAHTAGADFVKLFPADRLGPAYLKALRAPLPHLRLVPTGGVDLTTIGALFQAGAAAVGAGSSLVPAELVRDANWTALSELAGRFVAAARQSRLQPGS
jgi:2-dehydro-3-deoxyphosphogluconate aldolase/(4S)-4-hydroxy-2-oxoglutarate aldolase